MKYNIAELAKSKEEALERNERMYYDEGNQCVKGHPPIKKINSLTPLKSKCYECLLEQGRRKAARKRADPIKLAILKSGIARINKDRYNNDPEFKKAVLARKTLRRGVDKSLQYGISEEDISKLHSSQNGECAICGESKSELTIDHDHSTGMVRELLCHQCNTAIGLFKENVNVIENSIKYLHKHNKRKNILDNIEEIYNNGSIPKSAWQDMNEDDIEFLKGRLFSIVRNLGFPYPEENDSALLKAVNDLSEYVKKTPTVSNSTVSQTMHGLGELWGYFKHAFSVKCNGRLSPLDMYNDDKLLMKCIDHRFDHGTYVSKSGMRKSLSYVSPTQSVSNFRPSAAAGLYKYFGGGVIFDPCAGWGGRLMGAVASGIVTRYVGVDASRETVVGLKKVAAVVMPDAEIYHGAVEDFKVDEPFANIILTSPPYFDCEDYSDDGYQSHVRYKTKEEWVDGFLKPFINKCYASLFDGGYLLLNINNVNSFKNLLTEAEKVVVDHGGFILTEYIRMTLSNRGKAGYKYEPIMVYRKRDYCLR